MLLSVVFKEFITFMIAWKTKAESKAMACKEMLKN